MIGFQPLNRQNLLLKKERNPTLCNQMVENDEMNADSSSMLIEIIRSCLFFSPQ